jgi:exopolyphosphatase/guanosine-5'-triphosphate,3'-diphosphate pyrophosphatase
LDLGSNSFHLLVADAHPDGTFEPLARDKEMLRLGSVVAATGEIGDLAAYAAIETVARFRALAESLGAEEIVARATAAFRDARDSATVVDRIEEETGVKVKVISGKEEARLIFGAVRASVVIEPGPGLGLDLGGGSLELTVGDASGLRWSSSLKLGVGRLTADLIRSDPPTGGDRRRVVHAVTTSVGRILPEIARLAPRIAIGSSGTLATLIRLAAARRGGPLPLSVNQLSVTTRELDALSQVLLRMTSDERAGLPGVDIRRADLLPAGALLAVTLLDLTGLDELVGCDWALREGIVLDAIGSHSQAEWSGDPRAMRRESVLGLCRRCGWNEAHARKVGRLAQELFDETIEIHGLDADDRDILEMGALVHDIGEHVSMEGHERHAAYLIQNGRLRGFTPRELAVLACLGRFHKRGSPKTSFEPFASLPPIDRDRVGKLIALLQVADALDRSHGGPVHSIEVYTSPGLVEVVVHADDDIDLELWGLRRKRALFERVFRCRLDVTDAQLTLPLDGDLEEREVRAGGGG